MADEEKEEPKWIKSVMWFFLAIFIIILAVGIVLVVTQPNFAQNLVDTVLGTTTTTIGG